MPQGIDDLDGLSDDALAQLEDQLLLEAELSSARSAQFTLARGMIFVLTFITIMIYLQLYARFLPSERLGPLNIPLYLITLGLGVATVQLAWKQLPRVARQGVRWMLDHWPVLVYLGAWLIRSAE